MGSLDYLRTIEAVPDLKNPDFIQLTERGGNYVLNVDKEKAEGGNHNFGIDIQYEDG